MQAQVLDVMRGLQQEFGTAIVLITHDLGVVADMADDVVVMYGGQVMERAPRRELFYRHHHPYTEGLLRSLPTAGRRGRLTPIGGTPPSLITPPPGCPFAPALPVRVRRVRRDAAAPGDRPGAHVGVLAARTSPEPLKKALMTALLEVADVCKYFPVGRRRLFGAAPPSLRAVDGVSLEVGARRDARAGGGDRLRQVHAGPLHDPAVRPDGGPGHVRRHRHQHAVARRDAPAAPRDADDLPGPVRLAEPAPPGRLDHRRPVRHPRRRRRRRSASARCRS